MLQESKLSNEKIFANNNEIKDLLTEQRHRPFAKCHTFNPSKKMRENGIYYMKGRKFATIVGVRKSSKNSMRQRIY